jgi:RHS repeat-associated protein
MTVIGQATVNYTWDNANHLTGITQGTSAVGLSYYDAASRRQSLTLPNGIVVGYSYDLDSHVNGMTWKLNGSQIGDLEYSYDADGRVSQKTGSMEQPGLPWTGSMGNTYNADNELTGFNGTVPTYDANGNLTSDGTYTYTWDARNHLSGAAGASFVYDAFGRRVQNGTQGDEFLYDGLNPVQTLVSGTPNANILTGLGIDEYFQWTDSSGSSDLLTDALGSTLALADSTGTIQTTYNYDPFGATSINYFQSSNPFQFTGRENDWPNLYPPLYYYRARYYSPMFDRFIAQDPFGFLTRAGRGHESGAASSVALADPDTNLYRYVDDDPSSYVDPLGLYWIVIRGSIWPWFLALHYPDNSTCTFPDHWGLYEIQGCPGLICVLSDDEFQQGLENYHLASDESEGTSSEPQGRCSSGGGGCNSQ